VHDRTFQGVQRTYGAVPVGEALALVSSGGFLEIGVNQGNCAAQLGVSVGEQVRLRVG
jgi:S-adenosylmethionine hydrolase